MLEMRLGVECVFARFAVKFNKRFKAVILRLKSKDDNILIAKPYFYISFYESSSI